MKVVQIIKAVIISSRPVHWVKNLSLFAAILFSGFLLDKIYFEKVFVAFIIFNFIASATYIFNDVLDYKLDSIHPIKKNRPVASGALSPSLALLVSISLFAVSLFFASILNPLFFLLCLTYVVIQVLYSLGLKNQPIIDILIIASGFIIRVYAGAFVVDIHLSVWFLLCVISTALFIASGKRRAEMNVIKTSGVTRKSLVKYKEELLNSYVTMFGNASWLSWALYTFYESPQASPPVWLFLAELSRTTTINKLLMLTIPVVIFVIMRYESLIFEGESEAPEKLLLRDKSLIISISIWVVMIYLILYGGVSIL